MNLTNTQKKITFKNKKSGRKKKSFKGGSPDGRLSLSDIGRYGTSVAKKLAIRGTGVATTVVTAANTLVDPNQFHEKALRQIQIFLEKHKSSFFDKLNSLNSIPGLREVSSFFYQIVELMMSNLPLIDLESSRQIINNLKHRFKDEPEKIRIYLKNRLRMFSYNPKTVTQEYFKDKENWVVQFEDDDKNALVFTILSYNFEKIQGSPEENDSNTVFEILRKQPRPIQGLWHEVPDFNSKILEGVKSIKIGLNFDDIKQFQFDNDGSQLSIHRNSQPTEKTVKKEKFNYRKYIMKDTDKQMSKFFIFKLTDIRGREQTVISIRGTRSLTDVTIDLKTSTKTLKDVKETNKELKEFFLKFPVDFNPLLLNVLFHEGFLLSTLKIFKKIYINYLSELPKSEQILLCGHSMGGAEAAILGLFIKFCEPLKNINLKIITFNPGTYIVRNNDYYTMTDELRRSPTFKNWIFRFAGDLISVCSRENISQTASILSEPTFKNQSDLLEQFTTNMLNSTNKQSPTCTDLLDVKGAPEPTISSDVITMWTEESKKFYYLGNYKIPFLITGRVSVDTHSLSNFKELILENHPFNEGSVSEIPVEDTKGPFDFISQMITLRTKVKSILDSLDLGKSFASFTRKFEKIREHKQIISKIHERADSFFNMEVLSKLPGLEKQKSLLQKIFSSLSSLNIVEGLKEQIPNFQTDYENVFQFVNKSQSDTSGGNSFRKKRKGRILRKSTFKRNTKQKGGTPEGIALGILQIYLGFLFCPILTSLFLICCGPMICINLMASF